MKKNRRKANKWKKAAAKLRAKFQSDPGGPGAKRLLKKMNEAYTNWYDAMGAK